MNIRLILSISEGSILDAAMTRPRPSVMNSGMGGSAGGIGSSPEFEGTGTEIELAETPMGVDVCATSDEGMTSSPGMESSSSR